ncbi:MAG: aminotransferase class I/II-fold pyridoxal phosphate-dependent enzyme [Burkholderiaceae bacterium]|nr:aminotransferase class I/II-fold pyridoxal phosphate-dependent enzyme [Burkholderiaceae bacterium]
MTSTPPELIAALARIRPDVQGMHAYAVPDSTGLLKMDAMENPYRLPPALRQTLGERLGQVAINRYPGGRADDLRAALARHAGLPAGWALMLGNGSDELIGLLALACDVPGASILAPAPSFVMYQLSAQLQGLGFHAVPLAADFALDEAAMLAAIERHGPALVYLAHPNNPTGTLWDAATIARIAAAQAARGALLVLDEAYQPFATRTWLDVARADAAAHSHVLVMRTLSKFGLAGVRVGYLMGDARLIAQIDKVRPPYNLSALNIECALFALEHADEFAAQAAAIRAQRAALLDALAAMPGVRPYPSEGNMVLARVADSGDAQADAHAAQRVFEGMRARKVLVKNVSTMHPMLAGCLRLTVGSAPENAQMLAALQDSL